MDACRRGFRGEATETSCLLQFATPGVCPAPGQTLIPEESSVRIAEGVTTDASVDPGALQDACTYSDLTPTFRQNFNSLPAVRWQYFGTVQGVHRTYPARLWTVEDEQCKPYDPRRRPWFISAASGPKNVMILLDDSSSMSIVEEGETRQRMQIAADAAADVIETLTANDYIGVIRFSDRTTPWSDSGLERATDDARARAIAFIRDSRPRGTRTVYREGLEAAKAALDNAVGTDFENTRHTDCLSTVLFLTDGEAQDGMDGVSAAAEFRSAAPQVAFFAYSFGEAALLPDERNVAKMMACAAGGLWLGVEDGSDLVSAMSQYY